MTISHFCNKKIDHKLISLTINNIKSIFNINTLTTATTIIATHQHFRIFYQMRKTCKNFCYVYAVYGEFNVFL